MRRRKDFKFNNYKIFINVNADINYTTWKTKVSNETTKYKFQIRKFRDYNKKNTKHQILLEAQTYKLRESFDFLKKIFERKLKALGKQFFRRPIFDHETKGIAWNAVWRNLMFSAHFAFFHTVSQKLCQESIRIF